MKLSLILSALGVQLALLPSTFSLPRGRRQTGHEKFVLIRAGHDHHRREVAEADTSAEASINGTAGMNNYTVVPNTHQQPVTPFQGSTVNSTSSISNATGHDTIPPNLNTTDPSVSAIVSSLLATSTAYSTFTYSAYIPLTSAALPSASSSQLPSAIPTSTPIVDPVQQAIQVAESYALQQQIGKHLPTVTVELVMIPTQEPDGSWDYVVRLGADGTATASPTFVQSAASVSQTQADWQSSTAVQADTNAQSSGGFATSSQPELQQTSPTDTQQYESPPNGTPVTQISGSAGSPTFAPVYGSSQVAASSIEGGRGAVTFAYTTQPRPTQSQQADPTAWVSGKGQQHAYPWMTESEVPPVQTISPGSGSNDSPSGAVSAAWTSGKGQQHAYPWTTEWQSPPAPSVSSTNFWVPSSQEPAYPSSSVIILPSAGVEVVTLRPTISVGTNGPRESFLSDSINPYLVSATKVFDPLQTSTVTNMQSAGSSVVSYSSDTARTAAIVSTVSAWNSVASGIASAIPSATVFESSVTVTNSVAYTGTVSASAESMKPSATSTGMPEETQYTAISSSSIRYEGLQSPSVESSDWQISTAESNQPSSALVSEQASIASASNPPSSESESTFTAVPSQLSSAVTSSSATITAVTSEATLSTAKQPLFTAWSTTSSSNAITGPASVISASSQSSIASASGESVVSAAPTLLESALPAGQVPATMASAPSSVDVVPTQTITTAGLDQASSLFESSFFSITTPNPSSYSVVGSIKTVPTDLVSSSYLTSQSHTSAETGTAVEKSSALSASMPSPSMAYSTLSDTATITTAFTMTPVVSMSESRFTTTAFSPAVTGTESQSYNGDEGVATETLTDWMSANVTMTLSQPSTVSPSSRIEVTALSSSVQQLDPTTIASSVVTLPSAVTSSTWIESAAQITVMETAMIPSTSSEPPIAPVSASMSSFVDDTSRRSSTAGSLTQSATAAIPEPTDLPLCSDVEGDEDWEEVWVDSSEIQPDWIVLE